MTDVPRYIVYDVEQVQQDLGDHEITARTFVRCTMCNARHYQRHNECSGCGIAIVWKNSTIWRDLWGSANTAIRRLKKVPATDPAGIALMKYAREPGFANQGEYDRWMVAVRKLGDLKMEKTVDFVASKGAYGRPLIAHALNLVAKIARETEKPAPAWRKRASKKKTEILR